MNKLLIFGICLFSSIVSAGNATSKITAYIPYSSGNEEMFFIYMSNFTDKVTCNTTSRFTMKSSNPKFKATQAAVLAAYFAKTDVHAKGLGTCSNFSNSEDLNYLCLGISNC